MAQNMYLWRQLTDAQRADALEYRRLRKFPKHSPPHFDVDCEKQFLITAACYEHQHVIGRSAGRMTDFEASLLDVCQDLSTAIHAWCVLPNHYHILLKTKSIKALRKQLGLLHGRTSFTWNNEEDTRGRKVWHNCFERKMRSERHYFASLNYVLNNAVHHGYCDRWQDWHWSNANDYLREMGVERALEIWREYPILDYGSKWDIY
jgi:putative transposase